jgi:glycerophosphoryl diester phosphodiesterase
MLLAAAPVFAYLERITHPLIIAHRAGALVVPENTIEGWIEAKIRYKPDVWELDVHLTADDILVVIHDESVDRTTNGSGLVIDMSFAEISEFDAGFWFTPDSGRTHPWRGKGVRVPALAEVFDSFPTDFFNIEIKDSIQDAADRLLALIQEKGMQEKVLVASAYTDILKRVRELDPSLPTSGSEDEVKAIVILGKMGLGILVKTPMDVLQVPEYVGSIHVVTPGLLRRCHKRGIQVHVWTVNDADSMQRLLEMGADGIVTDRPDVADRVFKTMGFRKFQSPEAN